MEEEVHVVQVDYSELYQNDRERFGMLLLELTNIRSNGLGIYDFRTFPETNLMDVTFDLDQISKEGAEEFLKAKGLKVVRTYTEWVTVVDSMDYGTLEVYVK